MSFLGIRSGYKNQLHFHIKKKLLADASYKKDNISKCNKTLKSLRMNETKKQCEPFKTKRVNFIERWHIKWTDIKFMDRKTQNNKSIILPQFPRIRLYIYENLTHEKDGTVGFGTNGILLNSRYWDNWLFTWKKRKLNFYLLSCQKKSTTNELKASLYSY